MELSRYLDALREHGDALGADAARSDLAASVPSCPGWTVADLVGHTGAIHRWASAHVLAGPNKGRIAEEQPPAEGLLDWYQIGLGRLIEVLESAPADLDCWTFFGAPSPCAFWDRRQAHETAMHRVDADAVLGRIPDLDAEFAADGIDELLAGFFSRKRGELVADPPRSLLVEPTDVSQWWHFTVLPDARVTRTSGPRDADLTLRGRAADLYLTLWNREPAQAPEWHGDADVLGLWRERARIT